MLVNCIMHKACFSRAKSTKKTLASLL